MANETFGFKLVKFLIYTAAIPGLTLITALSLIYQYFTSYFRPISSVEEHKRQVAKVQGQVLEWNRKGKPNFMCTARRAWRSLSFHNMNKSKYTQINVDQLDSIVEINEVERTVTVEPGVTMGKITSTLIPRGWTIPVVPEFEYLTVGGLVCGAGIESSSHKYGLFVEPCISYELLMADGTIIICTKSENAELFRSIPMSHGTIAFLTAVKIPLIRAEKYVRLEYIPVHSLAEAMPLFNAHENDFIEGIMYSPTDIVVMHGNMTNEVDPRKVNSIGRWYKQWFYKYAESFLSKKQRVPTNHQFIEYIPLRDYYHRHTRSIFWELEAMMPYGNSPIIRYLFGWIVVESAIGKKLASPRLFDLLMTAHLVHDFIIPMANLDPYLKSVHELLKIYPLWLCPCTAFPHDVGPGKHLFRDFMDIGIYGNIPKEQDFHPYESIRKLEKLTMSLKGMQGLYADHFLTDK